MVVYLAATCFVAYINSGQMNAKKNGNDSGTFSLSQEFRSIKWFVSKLAGVVVHAIPSSSKQINSRQLIHLIKIQ